MSGKSTPGPWIRSKHGSQILTADGEQNIALVSIPILFTDEQHEEVLANARLIAAAPDLLAALKEAVDDIAYWAEYASEYIRDKHGLTKSLNEYDALIAKIEGQS